MSSDDPNVNVTNSVNLTTKKICCDDKGNKYYDEDDSYLKMQMKGRIASDRGQNVWCKATAILQFKWKENMKMNGR